eukprot:SAG22_NODE_1066_length_5744_cov_7.937290_4_plen_94_part_00
MNWVSSKALPFCGASTVFLSKAVPFRAISLVQLVYERPCRGPRPAACHTPTHAEVRSMAWQAVAAGTWSRTATRDLCPFACHLKASLFASWTT